MHLCMHGCMHVRAHVCFSSFVRIYNFCMHVCVYEWFACIYARMICMHICTHVVYVCFVRMFRTYACLYAYKRTGICVCIVHGARARLIALIVQRADGRRRKTVQHQ